jgi:hypothetical protein
MIINVIIINESISYKKSPRMSKVKLTAKWQLDAALLSRPVDLTALVSLSRSNPLVKKEYAEPSL